MNARNIMRMIQVLVLVCASAMFMVGCEDEDSPDTGSLDDWFARNPMVNDPRSGTSTRDILVDPESAALAFAGQKINFRASGGRGPYTWDVAVTLVGTIAALGNTAEAVYTATAMEGNSIIVYDSRGQAGVATVSAQSMALVAVANPDTITQVGGRSILTATGGVPPYTWTVSDGAVGSIDGPSVGNSVVYVASTVGSGDNTVRCTDSVGGSVNVLIMQP